MSIKSSHHHLQQLLFILVWGIISLVLKYMCFVSADSTEKAKNQKNITLPQVIQLSIQISIHGVYFPGVLDYITIFKNSLHVFCFCKVVLQEQKHIQGFLGLTEMFYPWRSGC